MTEIEPDMNAKNLATLYDLPTLEWEPIAAQLEAGYPQAPGTGGPNRHTTWIATIDDHEVSNNWAGRFAAKAATRKVFLNIDVVL